MTLPGGGPEPDRVSDAELRAAYKACAQIARRQAKNFYYAFLALPRQKRDAICAVYAFMRHADDISDDESRSRAERRTDLDAWLDAWHRAAAGARTTDPVFLALDDTRRRFAISMDLLDQLVHGTAMDLDTALDEKAAFAEAPEAQPWDTYATFEDLRRYCYYVASVVGLVCIRIFGYTDPRAEKLAEDTGVAFQLTNILRDVREDAERGRIYLPLEDLDRHNVSIHELAALRDGSHLTLNQRELLEGLAKRAEDSYASGRQLLPLIAPDARPALWVLVTIYHRLLRRIERRGFDVFSERVSVPLTTRLSILFRGLVRILFNRLTGAAGQHA
ncbi:MAG TPA: phytoene/squalene synthase family protein [Acidobacteriaceae bacterium]|nr:phytoene/squalene synthase family protein [Acidobacteriaceae bacterium]